MGMRSAFQRVRDGYVRFVEKQGFAIIAVVCVAVITATAIWTDRQDTYVAPTPPAAGDVSAAQLMQQPLRDAATATPAPSAASQAWTPPLADTAILRPFSTSGMIKSGVTGIWAIHDAVDLSASRGDRVCAIADGTVRSTGDDELLGVWLLIDHNDGVEALYAGLAAAGAYIAGDKVRAGDTIGFAGGGPLDETDLAPHLHLRVTQNGQAIDPALLWNAAR